MKSLFLSLALIGTAQANTIHFDTPASCPTYCADYHTDTGDTISFINMVLWSNTGPTYHLLVGLNGVTYQTAATIVQDNGPMVLVAPDGSTITIDFSWHVYKRYVSSGRAHYYITRYLVDYGTITQ